MRYYKNRRYVCNRIARACVCVLCTWISVSTFQCGRLVVRQFNSCVADSMGSVCYFLCECLQPFGVAMRLSPISHHRQKQGFHSNSVYHSKAHSVIFEVIRSNDWFFVLHSLWNVAIQRFIFFVFLFLAIVVVSSFLLLLPFRWLFFLMARDKKGFCGINK